MKIAICLSGQIRNIRPDNKVVSLINRLDADVFLSTWSDFGNTSSYDRLFPSSSIANLFVPRDGSGKFMQDRQYLNEKFPSVESLFYKTSRVSEDFLLEKIPNLKKIKIDDVPPDFVFDRELEGVVYPEKLLEVANKRSLFCLPMFYKIYDSFKLLEEWGKETGVNYDVVIRSRIDLDFDDLEYLVCKIMQGVKENTIHTCNRPPGTIDRDIFVNDTFAFGGFYEMQRYSRLFMSLSDYWSPDKYLDFPYALRVSECLLGYHLFKNEKLNHEVLDTNSPVDVKINRKKYSEVLFAFLPDYLMLWRGDINYSKALSILLGGYVQELISEQGVEIAEAELFNIYKAHDFLDDVFISSWAKASIHRGFGRGPESLVFYEIASSYLGDVDVRPSFEYSQILIKSNKNADALRVLNAALLIEPRNYLLMREISRAYLGIFKSSLISSEKNIYLDLSKYFSGLCLRSGGGMNRMALDLHKGIDQEVLRFQSQT